MVKIGINYCLVECASHSVLRHVVETTKIRVSATVFYPNASSCRGIQLVRLFAKFHGSPRILTHISTGARVAQSEEVLAVACTS